MGEPSGMTTIEVRGLTKRYGPQTVVDDLSFTVEPGHVTGFLGPNGAGKSTTMRMILGLTPPTSGSVRVGRREYGRLPVPLTERTVEDTAAAVASGDLGRRVPEPAPPGTEIGRLSGALNTMLGQLERAFAERAASEERMREFVSDVSHELRTPLFGIKGSTELYRMGALTGPADVDATMHRIEREAARLTALTEDLLLLARLDQAPGAALEPAPMDLRTLAGDARHDLRALDRSRPVEITGPDGGPPGPAPVLGDEARLRQVVANLVGNAAAHTPSGTPVRIGVGTADGRAVLDVADEGPGMSEEQAARVFDRFYRADRSRDRSGGGGTGLGLAIARSLARAHGGDVELATSPGEGARFRLALPLAVPPGDPERGDGGGRDAEAPDAEGPGGGGPGDGVGETGQAGGR